MFKKHLLSPTLKAVMLFTSFVFFFIMNEWMMDFLCSALCIVVHPKHFTIMWGGLSSTTTSVQHPLGWYDGCHRITAHMRSPHTPATGGEERESLRQSSGWGLLGGHEITRASGGNLARTPGLHPYFVLWNTKFKRFSSTKFKIL